MPLKLNRNQLQIKGKFKFDQRDKSSCGTRGGPDTRYFCGQPAYVSEHDSKTQSQHFSRTMFFHLQMSSSENERQRQISILFRGLRTNVPLSSSATPSARRDAGYPLGHLRTMRPSSMRNGRHSAIPRRRLCPITTTLMTSP